MKKTPLLMKFFYGADSDYVEVNGEVVEGGYKNIDAEVLLRIINYKFDLGLQIENEDIDVKRDQTKDQ